MDKIFLNHGVAFEKCNRKYMEDFNKVYITDKIKYFSICDGHGGDLISKYVNDNFLKICLENLYNLNPNNYYTFFTNIIMELENDMRYIKNIGETSGTTFVLFIIYENFIYIVNIGDSIATIYKNNNIIYKNIRHTPKNAIEKLRILKTSNIINNRINGSLNVSRALGDYYLKPSDINISDWPITCLPDINYYNIEDFINTKTFILLASDGILLQLSLETINNYIYEKLVKGYDPQVIANNLVKFYKHNNNNDNVTIIIITMNNFLTK